jgi:molybdopterin/thiamine biosynthesis adenylyltransferase
MWDYEQAFCRHIGLIAPQEQERLRRSKVAIMGMGGVGGIHLMTLTRLGIGRFAIADPDRYELANINRQYGATLSTLGLAKTDVMAREARAVNPDLEIDVHPSAVDENNIGRFLDGANLFVDGIDFFNIGARRVAFREAQRRGIWAITAAPIGFSAAWLLFDPQGMTFDQYFDLHDDMKRHEQLAAFAVGLAPRATHFQYLDLSRVSFGSNAGPSVAFACHLASGVMAAEALKILLGRTAPRAAPHYSQFDAYRCILRHGKLRFGNRHPLQRLKRWWLNRQVDRKR